MKTIILCAGNQKRFGSGLPPKQLLPIFDNSRIIDLIIGNARLWNTDPTMFVKNTKVFDGVDCHQVIVPYYERRCTAGTLKYATEWVFENNPDEESFCCLLGDVVYSSQAIQDIFDPDYRDVVFFISKDGQEILAIRFKKHHLAFFNAIEAAIKYFYRSKGRGKLWNVYYAYQGISQAVHQIKPDNTFIVKDWTTYVDSRDEYVALKTILEEKYYEQINF